MRIHHVTLAVRMRMQGRARPGGSLCGMPRVCRQKRGGIYCCRWGLIAHVQRPAGRPASERQPRPLSVLAPVLHQLPQRLHLRRLHVASEIRQLRPGLGVVLALVHEREKLVGERAEHAQRPQPHLLVCGG